MPTHLRQRKALRGVLSATYATLVALAGHLLAGGELASGWVGLLLTLALSTLVCTALAGQTRSLVRLTLSVGVSQWIFHTVFSASSIVLETQGHHALMFQETPHHGGGSEMVAGHILAGILTVLGFQYTEKICEAIARFTHLVIRWILPFLLPLTPLHPEQQKQGIQTYLTLLPLGVLHAPLLVRGPPLSFSNAYSIGDELSNRKPQPVALTL